MTIRKSKFTKVQCSEVIGPDPAVWPHGEGLNVSGAEASIAGEKGGGYSYHFHFQDSGQVVEHIHVEAGTGPNSRHAI